MKEWYAMKEREKMIDTLNNTTIVVEDLSGHSSINTRTISDRIIWLIYLLLTGLSSVLAIVRGYRDITTSVIDVDFVQFFVMPDLEPLILSYIASGTIAFINLLSFFGAIFIYYGLHHTKNRYVYVGIGLSKIFYCLLVVILTIGVIVNYIGLAGPFFLMPFALIPMIVFGMVFALMKHTLLRFSYFFGNLDSYMKVSNRQYSKVKLRNSIRLSTILLVCAGISMIIVSIMVKIFVDDETIGNISKILFSIYPFSISAYLYSMISVLYIFMVSNRFEGPVKNVVTI